jgi:hypothetical protein
MRRLVNRQIFGNSRSSAGVAEVSVIARRALGCHVWASDFYGLSLTPLYKRACASARCLTIILFWKPAS